MKPKLFTAAILIFINVLHACGIEGNGNVISKTRAVPVFTGVDLSCSGHVYITQGDKQEVKIEAEENLMDYLETVVNNGELIIRSKENFDEHKPINIYITVKELCLVELSGSGEIATKNEITCDHMSVRLSGSGNISAQINSKSIKTSLSGSGELTLSGRSAEADFRIVGSGNINAEKLKTFTSAVTISGSGNSRVDVDNQLDVTITGSGNVYYTREPGKIDSRITGSGNIFKI